MAVDKKLLEILCCPVSKAPVRSLNRGELTRLNQRIETGGVTQANGETVNEALSEGLITENGERIYPVEDGIPVMLEER
ncbi:MAG: Trm112 family protein [Ectothiorhodospiraceae bacterium]|nr:Trm112 family protein [Ectothiorhodospiraceae bacterium]